MFRIRASVAAYAARFMAQKDVRYYLNGIRVEPCPDGGAIVVATDGIRLVAMHDPLGQCDAPTICKLDARVLAQLRKPGERHLAHSGSPDAKHQRVTVTWLENGVFPRVVAVDEDAPLILDANYPDWRRLIPADELAPGFVCDVNAKLLEGLAVGSRHSPVRFYQKAGERHSPIVARPVTTGSTMADVDVVVVIMPMRDCGALPTRPKWVGAAESARDTTAVGGEAGVRARGRLVEYGDLQSTDGESAWPRPHSILVSFSTEEECRRAVLSGSCEYGVWEG